MYADDTNIVSLIDWGVELTKAIGPSQHLPETLRKVDFVLMNASALRVIRPGTSGFPGF